MKHNLKNRPKPKFDVESPYCGGWLRTYTEWFKGFKKELQYFYDNSVTITDEERKLIKEILGE